MAYVSFPSYVYRKISSKRGRKGSLDIYFPGLERYPPKSDGYNREILDFSEKMAKENGIEARLYGLTASSEIAKSWEGREITPLVSNLFSHKYNGGLVIIPKPLFWRTSEKLEMPLIEELAKTSARIVELEGMPLLWRVDEPYGNISEYIPENQVPGLEANIREKLSEAHPPGKYPFGEKPIEATLIKRELDSDSADYAKIYPDFLSPSGN
ncbi:MAG: hypothetical protein JW727_04115 [Candidatus Aenigmarchaeota archaeon]|nr:hypothetical protein [Candidatus Aenigmarchaeota archaeon]